MVEKVGSESQGCPQDTELETSLGYLRIYLAKENPHHNSVGVITKRAMFGLLKFGPLKH